MKKNFRSYALIWAIMLAAFNAVVFLVRPVIPGYVVNYDARFWIAWGFILAAFIGNLVCAYFAFKAQSLKKLFYNLPLITVSYAGLIVMLVLGGALMLIPGCPAWIAAAACFTVLAGNAAAIIKVGWAADAVNAVDEKIKAQTAFIKTATLNAQNIANRAKSPAISAACQRVYEALRYSDPMSSDALSAEEAKIAAKIEELAAAVNNADEETAGATADETVLLIKERNNKCRLLKNQ